MPGLDDKPIRSGSIEAALRQAAARLSAAGCARPMLEAEALTAHALKRSRESLLAHATDPLEDAARRQLELLVEERVQGRPLAYIVGTREFWSRPFTVDERVLIPRPETELLVEQALAAGLPPNPLVWDAGTGSGCLAVTLAIELETRVVATDTTEGALAIARRNVERHGCGARVELRKGDLAGALRPGERFDLIVANPPYVSRQTRALLAPETARYEPPTALFADEEGLAVIRRLLACAPAFMEESAVLLMEFGIGQAAPIRRLAGEAGLRVLDIVNDYASIERVLVARREGT